MDSLQRNKRRKSFADLCLLIDDNLFFRSTIMELMKKDAIFESTPGVVSFVGNIDNQKLPDVDPLDESLPIETPIVFSEEVDYDMQSSSHESDSISDPPIYKNRQFLLYGTLVAIYLVLTFVCFTIVAVFWTGQKGKDEGEIPPSIIQLRATAIRNELERVIPPQMLNNEITPHWHAMDWIINEDPQQRDRNHPLLLQRFMVALFYFSTTTQERPWISCNPSNREIGEDGVCLYKSKPSIRWLSAAHECRWAGIVCNFLNETVGINLGKRTPHPVADQFGSRFISVALFFVLFWGKGRNGPPTYTTPTIVATFFNTHLSSFIVFLYSRIFFKNSCFCFRTRN